MNIDEVNHWLVKGDSPHFILAYGSLLSADSRERYSNITHVGIPTYVKGFSRGWVTRAFHENQTYVGAVPNSQTGLSAQLLPVNLNPALQKREQDYRFVEVDVTNLFFDVNQRVSERLLSYLAEKTVWICETLESYVADANFPVNQSYVDTCLAGCLEHGGIAQAESFIQSTTCWDHPRVDDRKNNQYPRAAKVNSHTQSLIDKLLETVS